VQTAAMRMDALWDGVINELFIMLLYCATGGIHIMFVLSHAMARGGGNNQPAYGSFLSGTPKDSEPVGNCFVGVPSITTRTESAKYSVDIHWAV